MECKKYSELISAYVDDRLSQSETVALMAHLSVCETCQEELSALQAMTNLLNQMDEPELPEDFHQNLMKKIKDEHKDKGRVIRPIKWKWQYSGALVASLMVGIVGISQLGHKLDNQQEMTADAAPYMMAAETAEGTLPIPEERSVVPEGAESAPSRRASSQIINWEITIKGQEEMVEAFKTYLEEEGLSYDMEKWQITCHEVEDSSALMTWFTAQGISVLGEVTDDTTEIVIQFK